jgi:hypothetical protein
MLNTLQMIELAETHRAALRQGAHPEIPDQERAGPTARARFGRRVIALREQITDGTSLTITH